MHFHGNMFIQLIKILIITATLDDSSLITYAN